MSVLDGTQPTLTQVPPMVPWPISATLAPSSAAAMAAENPADPAPTTARSYRPLESSLVLQQSSMSGAFLRSRRLRTARSEEHTSELQSLMRISYAVFCLKKKNKQHTKN